MQTHKHHFCCVTYLLAPVPDRDVGLWLGLESHCSLWSVSNTWLRPWGAVARLGLRNSHSRAQTSPHNLLPTRGCPSVSTQCSPVGRHRQAQQLQAGAERRENRSVVTPRPARAGRCSRASTHGTQGGYCQQASSLNTRTGHCFSLLQKSKLLCKKQRIRNREENPLKCNHCLNKCLWGLYTAVNVWTPGCSQYIRKANWKSPFLKLFDHCCNWNQFGSWVLTVVF